MNHQPLKAALACWGATMLAAAGAAAATAATQLNGQLTLRPLTPNEQSAYKLTSLQKSAGISTVALGEPVYLDALVNLAIPPADITGVTWALTNLPVGSKAALTNSPLGTNVPVYKPADALALQVAGRQAFWPDVEGQYTVMATITTASEGTTNLAQTITAGAYRGLETCSLCHSGGDAAPNKVTPWSQTLHSQVFAFNINGGHDPTYSQSCFICHTVGYDANPVAAQSGGFYEIMTQLKWTTPALATNGNWASMQTNYPTLANLANIQCENCHGPGSQHALAAALNGPGPAARAAISVTYAEGDCGQCHNEPSGHVKSTEWRLSRHALQAISPPDATDSADCGGCHTGPGFAGRMSGVLYTNTADYEAITCAACHEPHDATNAHQLRRVNTATLMDGTTVTNAGMGGVCMNCHMSRSNVATYVGSTAGSSHYGPHHGPQADMLEGVNGYTYGQTIPSSAHKDVVPDTCVTCHMQTVAKTDPAFLRAGDHIFTLSAAASGTNGPAQLTAACTPCHGTLTTFDFPRQDYDGDGVIDGVQTEVQHLMNNLALLLPPAGVAKSSLSINSTWTTQQLRAAWNYVFVQSDGSLGVHNLAYTVGLLKASIADVSGVSAAGGLPDAWVMQYFGSLTNANAAPNACPAGDGVPNWLKYALGLNPTVAGVTVPGGVVWANQATQVSSGNTNSIAIYTAAEVAFTTQTNMTYQLQAISDLGGGWQNVGSPITGTGSSMSFLTPTRNDKLQFFRVLSQ